MLPALLLLLALPAADPGGDALAVFAAKCAGCHGPKAKQVQGNFGFVTDLKKLAADANKVVPGQPDQSNLWLLVSAGNMPPNPSGVRLTDAEKEVIRGWIAAGAPGPSAPPAPGNSGVEGAPPPGVTTPAESFPAHLLRWAGECHLLLLHFPVVCVLAAVLAELLGVWRKMTGMEAVVTFCLVVGAATGVAAAVCGWIYAGAGNGAGQPDTLLWHRWLGTTGAALLGMTALVTVDPSLVWYPAVVRRVLLGLATAVILAAAHLGGVMAFGEKFLSW